MKKFLIKILIVIMKCFLNVMYFFMKKSKLKNKVILISRQVDYPSLDFKRLEQEIKNQDNTVEIKIFCKTIKKGIVKKISYSIYMLKIMANLANSKVCIIDGYSIPVSILKQRKELVVIQIWHALGAIKKFGYQSLGTKEGRDKDISDAMNMHKNYTYIIAPSNATKILYQKAFNVAKEKILIMGMPRIDYLLKKNPDIEKQILNDYPELKNKKNILYVPTFRKNQQIKAEELIKAVNMDKYNLIIKKHPSEKLEDSEGCIVDNKYGSIDWLDIADYIITDYSAIAFEAALKNKPTYFYLYDIEEYQKNRGLNINLFEEMSSSTSKEAKNIINKIESDKYNYEELNKFVEKYIETKNTNNTEEIAKFVLRNIKRVI